MDDADPTVNRPTLFVLGGLPASGKTTIGRMLARECHAAFLRVDSIEQAIVATTGLTQPLGPVGYVLGYALAGDQLRLGLSVVAEAVNPLAVTRAAWRDVGAQPGADVVEVEVVCTDTEEHRRRAQTRVVDIPGLRPPTWPEIVGREYEPWDTPRLVVDTAALTARDCVYVIMDRAAALRATTSR